jgi:hypothetical protein
LQSGFPHGDFLEDEEGIHVILHGGEEGFRTEGGEVAVLGLEAEGAFEDAELFVKQLGATVVAFDHELGARFRAFEFGVGVVGVAELVVDLLDP